MTARKPKPSYARTPDGRFAKCAMCGKHILITDDSNPPVKMNGRETGKSASGVISFSTRYYHLQCGHLPIRKRKR